MTTAEQPTPAAPPPEPRRLERSRERMIGGVGGGLGRYFGIDPIIFRIGIVALVLFGGAGLFVYLAAWLFVPAEGASKPPLGVRFFRGDGTVWKRIGLIALVLVGSAIAAIAAAWATGTGAGAAVACIVILLGVGMVAGAFRGGARWLIVPALAIALPSGVVYAADVDLNGGAGERLYRPQTIEEVRESYRLGAGYLRLDLRDVEFPAGDRQLDLGIGTGHIEVIVPDDVCVATDARVGVGFVGAVDRESGGIDVDWRNEPAAPAGVPRLVVDADVGIGAVTISDKPVESESSRGFESGGYGDNAACDRGPGRNP